MPNQPSNNPLETWDVLVGHVTSHWDRALLRVRSQSPVAKRFAPGSALCAVQKQQRTLLHIIHSHQKGKYWILDCGLSPQAAQNLKGADLYIHASMRPTLPKGQFYTDQILGMRVVTQNGKSLGEITDILESSAHAIYCTPQVMFPAVDEYLVERDFEGNVITVKDRDDWEELGVKTHL